jgi:putative FmdB family regulatory protein
MPTYIYFCEQHNAEFEAVHSINDELQECPTCRANNLDSPKPKRLIAGSTSFILQGQGWASDNYASKK